MDVRRLSARMTLQSPAATQDDAGQPDASWTTVATLWGDIRHLNGLEAIRAGADTSVVKASVRIRHRADVTAAMRLTYGTKTYQINAVLPDAGKRWLDLACEVVQ